MLRINLIGILGTICVHIPASLRRLHSNFPVEPRSLFAESPAQSSRSVSQTPQAPARHMLQSGLFFINHGIILGVWGQKGCKILKARYFTLYLFPRGDTRASYLYIIFQASEQKLAPSDFS